MKRLFPLAAVICLFVLWGCPKEQPEEPVLTPIQTSYTIGADGGSLDISFRTNQVCQIKSSAPSWLTVDSPTKAVTTKIFTAKASANSDENPRTANISITAGSLSATITITQEGRPKKPEPPTPEYSDVLENAGTSTYTVPAAGQDITVRVRSNVEYKVECSVDWITSTKADAPHVDDLKFHVAENTGAARNGAKTFTYGGELSFTVTVNKAEFVPAGDDPFMELSTTVVNPEGNGGLYTISVDANYPYTVDCDAQWIAVEQTGGDCVLRIDYNPGEDTRTAQLIFSCEGLVEIVTVSQPGSDATADPFDIGSNLSARGYANCYVVTKAGNFSFDAVVMGNGPAGYIWSEEDAQAQNLWPWEVASVSFTNYGGEKPSRAEILWDDNSTISNVSIDDNLKVSFTATGNKGNAVIAVYNRTNLLWSWHIWCTDSPKRMRHEALDGTPIVLLDRNLGATSCTPEDGAATYGCWYQFGRKDPLKLYHGVAGSMVEGELSVEHSV
ncbi:MAG: BACON domain-containing protein, partial [Bacteroidales bacterium]|nr:BACON domain-containing protein [Bacteroidales bacterium]